MGRERDNAEEEVGMLHGPAHVNRFILNFFLRCAMVTPCCGPASKRIGAMLCVTF